MIREWHREFGMEHAISDDLMRENLEVICEPKSEREVFELVRSRFGEGVLKGALLVDVGSGLGKLLRLCAAHNVRCVGVEPSSLACRITKRMIREEGWKGVHVIRARAESLPLKSCYADVVTSITVLEHVEDPDSSVRECMRILRGDGAFFALVPNFLSFWEGHYMVFFPPYLLSFKSLFKFYLKLRGRNTKALESLNFRMTPAYLRRLLLENGANGVEDLGRRRFLAKFQQPELIANRRTASIMRAIKRVPLLSLLLPLGIRALLRLRLHTPLIYSATK